jgi:hypothetical protein
MRFGDVRVIGMRTRSCSRLRREKKILLEV